MSHADARIGPDGYRYGVRFEDGSVMATWNGQTQRLRVEQFIARNPHLALVRQKGLDGKWEPVETEGPEDGHRFRISMTSAGSYPRSINDPEYHDTDWWDDQRAVVVRAWNLRDALRKAADLPLAAWFPEEDDPSAETRGLGPTPDNTPEIGLSWRDGLDALDALLNDCSQVGADHENFVRVSAVRDLVAAVRRYEEDADESIRQMLLEDAITEGYDPATGAYEESE